MCQSVCVCVWMCVCVYVCVCVTEACHALFAVINVELRC